MGLKYSGMNGKGLSRAVEIWKRFTQTIEKQVLDPHIMHDIHRSQYLSEGAESVLRREHTDVIASLRNQGILSSQTVRVKPLGGGISSEIYLLEDGVRKLVVKQALPKLRVQDDWMADTSRSQVEQRFIHYVRGIIPQNILPIVWADPAKYLFVMEFLAPGFATWKQQLLGGDFDAKVAGAVASLLATIHGSSWNDPVVQKQFATDENFYALRIH